MSLDKIGAVLKQERQKQGISVDEISRATRVSRAQVRAIEAGENSKLPARVYVRGFIRSYAKVLGMDTKALLELFGPVHLTQLEPQKPVEINQGVNKYFTLTHILLSSAIIFFLSFIVWMRGALRDYETAGRAINSSADVSKKEPPSSKETKKPKNQKVDIENNPAYLKYLEKRMKKHLPKGVKIKPAEGQKTAQADKAQKVQENPPKSSTVSAAPPSAPQKKEAHPLMPPPSVMVIDEGFGSAAEPSSWERSEQMDQEAPPAAPPSEERNF